MEVVFVGTVIEVVGYYAHFGALVGKSGEYRLLGMVQLYIVSVSSRGMFVVVVMFGD